MYFTQDPVFYPACLFSCDVHVQLETVPIADFPRGLRDEIPRCNAFQLSLTKRREMHVR